MIVFTSNRKHEGSKYEVYQVNVSSTSSLNCIVFTSTELIHYDSLVTVYHSAFHELIKQGQSLPSDEIVSFPKTHYTVFSLRGLRNNNHNNYGGRYC